MSCTSNNCLETWNFSSPTRANWWSILSKAKHSGTEKNSNESFSLCHWDNKEANEKEASACCMKTWEAGSWREKCELHVPVSQIYNSTGFAEFSILIFSEEKKWGKNLKITLPFHLSRLDMIITTELRKKSLFWWRVWHIIVWSTFLRGGLVMSFQCQLSGNTLHFYFPASLIILSLILS